MSSESVVYMAFANPDCFIALKHVEDFADSFAWANTGNRIAARIAMIAITTKSSIRVKAPRVKVISPPVAGELDILTRLFDYC